jgi:hypothetical protein
MVWSIQRKCRDIGLKSEAVTSAVAKTEVSPELFETVRCPVILEPNKIVIFYISFDLTVHFKYFRQSPAGTAFVVRVPGYRYKGPGSIPCTARFSEK